MKISVSRKLFIYTGLFILILGMVPVMGAPSAHLDPFPNGLERIISNPEYGPTVVSLDQLFPVQQGWTRHGQDWVADHVDAMQIEYVPFRTAPLPGTGFAAGGEFGFQALFDPAPLSALQHGEEK